MMMKLWDRLYISNTWELLRHGPVFLFILGLSLQINARQPFYTVVVNIASNNHMKNSSSELVKKARDESWSNLLQRISLKPAGDKLKHLEDHMLTSLIDSFSVDLEQKTSQGYKGTYRFHYNEQSVKKLFNAHDVPIIETIFPPTLVIPILKTENGLFLWDDANTMLSTWREMAIHLSYFKFGVPLGDITDHELCSPQDVLDGNKDALKKMMQRYGAKDIAIFIISFENSTIEVAAWPYMVSEGFEPTHITLDDTDEERKNLGKTCFRHLIEYWKNLKKIVHNAETYHTQITVPIRNFNALQHLSHQLILHPRIHCARLQRLKRNRATFSIVYNGTTESFDDTLNELGIRPILPTSGNPFHVA